ncbi:LapD/MoxY N-terminal periplasmic domain-containing protein [Marinobacterium sp. LSUCC0821]|uniref:bifunctional diguanylate cyclase/phosphodiesterase n=1 Tax=Marinobacterium sp. LSUCC0821 TaxID=2668067 RepID=UPI0014518646|nr:LapD/MoxY N-terminal periplasmic domain-containing protein [Marinobacterium sp. LSUCC0821]QJD70754.1 EAL domain-containing protein [Marinobacterium sp. LSUCC0821]
MPLRSQLILLVSAIFALIFSINFYLSINNIKDYLENESRIHAQDTATSLGLSLSPYISIKDDTILETMVNSIFDAGFYQEIRLDDIAGNNLVLKQNASTVETVPSWFINLLPMQTMQARSEINTGWVIGGVVSVTTHPGLGYFKLWNQAKETLTYSLAILLAAIFIASMFIQWLLRPLNRIESLANSISKGDYQQITPLPNSPEMHQVALTMNEMSNKVRKTINRLKQQLDQAGRRLHTDSLTGLETRVSLEMEMEERFLSRNPRYLMLIKLHELGAISKHSTPQQVDNYIRAFVSVVQTTLLNHKLSTETFYRLLGSEFIAIAELHSDEQCQALLEDLSKQLNAFGIGRGIDNVAHIGCLKIESELSASELIAAASEAHENAKLIGPNAFTLSTQVKSVRSREAWSKVIQNLLGTGGFTIQTAFPTYNFNNTHEPLFYESVIQFPSDTDIQLGSFIAMSEELGVIEQVDKQVLHKIIELLGRQEHQNTQITANLSLASINSNSFRSEIFNALQERPDIAERIIFSISSYVAHQAGEMFESFVTLAHRLNSKVQIKRFEARFIDMEQLKQSNIDYVRLARDYTQEISSDSSKQSFVEALVSMANIIELPILAESLNNEADRDTAKSLGLNGFN